MQFSNTSIESIAASLPEDIVSTTEIEQRLAPLYERLKLPTGRLELMTGIRERRLYPSGTMPSDASAAAGRAVLAKSSIKAKDIQLYIHSAVCRDMLEPATASIAHAKIGLPATTQIFDISNACLGFLNAITVAAAMIESGQIDNALISSGENSRPLLDQTLTALLDGKHTRQSIKPYFANLTIGSGAVAAIITRSDLLSKDCPLPLHLRAASVRSATEHSRLCQGDTHGADALAMQTDAEALLNAGLTLAEDTWEEFTEVTHWTADTPSHIITHQVGSTHRRKLYEMLKLDLGKDISSFETLGNTGSVALPVTLALAIDDNKIKRGEKTALLGIGSGLNCLMLAIES